MRDRIDGSGDTEDLRWLRDGHGELGGPPSKGKPNRARRTGHGAHALRLVEVVDRRPATPTSSSGTFAGAVPESVSEPPDGAVHCVLDRSPGRRILPAPLAPSWYPGLMFGARSTVVLWLVLVVLFMVFFTFFGGDSSPVSPTEGVASLWLSAGRPWVLLFAATAALFYWFMMRSHRLTLQGVALLEQGRYLQALERFEKARERNRFTPLGPYNVGVALSLLWRLAPAEAALAQAEQGARRLLFVKRNAPVLRALVAALAGRTEDAVAFLNRLDSEVRDGGTAQLARAVLACRRGAFREVLTLVDRLEVRRLGAVQGALGGALRAWALAEETGEVRHVDRVALFGETSPEVLRAEWPELVAFVERAPAA